MFRKKVYGQSKVEGCPFCGKQSITTNKQGFAVCTNHKDAVMNDMKCACGDYLDIKKGKYGVFFLCMACGPVSLSKAFSINDIKNINNETKETDPNVINNSNSNFNINTKNEESQFIKNNDNKNQVYKENNKNKYKNPNKNYKSNGNNSSTSNNFNNPNSYFKQKSKKEITIRSDDPMYFD